jgi:hypothetical protein
MGEKTRETSAEDVAYGLVVVNSTCHNSMVTFSMWS